MNSIIITVARRRMIPVVDTPDINPPVAWHIRIERGSWKQIRFCHFELLEMVPHGDRYDVSWPDGVTFLAVLTGGRDRLRVRLKVAGGVSLEDGVLVCDRRLLFDAATETDATWSFNWRKALLKAM